MSAAVKGPATRNHGPRRDLGTLNGLSRKVSMSFAQKAADPGRPLAAGEQPPRPTFHKLKGFLPQNVIQWVGGYIRHRFGPRHAFPKYDNPAVDNGVYRLENTATIAVAGDWAAGTDEAAAVAEQMITTLQPDITIHLGDVYYVGDEDELKETCLGIGDPDSEYAPCKWPHGKIGSFALNGNHEMYARGFAYFDAFLPTLGINGRKQKASFFCLENDFWRVIALDTGYNCLGIPILEKIPFLNQLETVNGDCRQRDEVLEWLTSIVQPEKDDRALILLSHHQYYSAFDGNYTATARQLAKIIHRPVLWFWGHEHRLAAYDAHQKENGITAIGRCVGHGGMPVDRNPPVKDADCATVLKFVDNRAYDSGEGIDVGFNGFLNLTFRSEQLQARYLDLTGHEVLLEEWVASNRTPTLVTFRPMTVAIS